MASKLFNWISMLLFNYNFAREEASHCSPKAFFPLNTATATASSSAKLDAQYLLPIVWTWIVLNTLALEWQYTSYYKQVNHSGCKLSARSIAFFDSDMSVCMALDALVIGTTFPKLTKRESDDIELSIHLYSLHSFWEWSVCTNQDRPLH